MSSAAGRRTHASTPSMRGHQSEATRLEEFRALYVEFARSMLNVANQRYVDAGREKVLVQEIQFSDNISFGSVPRLQMPLTHSGVNEPEV